MNDCTIKLITVTRETDANGFETATEASKIVFAEKLRVTRQEFYQSLAAGVRADEVFRVRYADYSAQEEFEYNSRRYTVIRTYATNADWIEITGHRK